MGIPKFFLTCAGIGAVGIAASTWTDSFSSSTGVSSTGSVGSVSVSGVVSACAATSVMVAPLNAPVGTNDNSCHSAAVITMRPCLSSVYSRTFTPTDTSITPSLASTRASSPSAVRLIFMDASMASGVSSLSITLPTTFVESWYMKTRGLRPSTGSDPGLNMTSCPPDTVANTL